MDDKTVQLADEAHSNEPDAPDERAWIARSDANAAAFDKAETEFLAEVRRRRITELESAISEIIYLPPERATMQDVWTICARVARK